MHFLFDENLPFRLAKGLQILDADNEYGKPPVHQFTHITEECAPGTEDANIVRLAKKLNAIIISQDDDYKKIDATYELIRKLRIGYILFKPPKKKGSNYDDIVSAFVQAWPNLKSALKGKKAPYMYIIERNGTICEDEKFKR